MKDLLDGFIAILVLWFKIVREQFRQVLAVVVVVIVDIVQEEDEPVAEVYTARLATSQHGIHNGCIFGRFVIATEQPILPAERDRPYGIFRKIVVHLQPAIEMVPGQLVVNPIRVPDGLANTAFGQNFGIFICHPFFKGDHDGIRQSGT